MRLDHAAIRVSDIERAVAWYREVLGLVETGRGDGSVHLGCGEGTDLALVAGGVGLDHFAYAVGSGEELAGVRRQLHRAGLEARETVHDPEPDVTAAVDVSLPSGHLLQLVMPRSSPTYLHPSERTPSAAHAPLDVDHVNLAARDPNGLAMILTTHLAFRLSDVHRMEDGSVVGVWLRQGERHHDFAALAHRRDALHHVAFSLASATAMLEFADRLAARGQHAEYGIGRHGPGANLFLYLRDPDGNRVEVTTEMALVPETAPTRIWVGKDPYIIDVWAPYAPPKEFWEVT